MNDHARKRCEALHARKRSAAELEKEQIRRQNMATVCHCSAELNRGAYLYLSVNDMYLGSGDFVLLMFSETSQASPEQDSGMDIYGRMFQYALIREEASAALQGHYTFYSSELDGRLVFLIVFHYGLLPAHREALLDQLSRHCREISEACRGRYALEVKVYMSAVIDRPEEIASRYHKLLNTATLHRYIGKAEADVVYRQFAPAPGSKSPLQLDTGASAKRIANAVAESADYRRAAAEVLAEMENAPFQSVDELKARFGKLSEELCAELKLRGFRLDTDRIQTELQTLVMGGNTWAEPVDWLYRFVDTVAENKRKSERSHSLRYFETADRIISEKLGDPSLSERSIADQLGISASYLTVLFRRQTQKSPTAYIREKRLTKAAEILRHTDKSVREVSEACGFGSVETFNRAFKEAYGMPPGKLKQLNRL